MKADPRLVSAVVVSLGFAPVSARAMSCEQILSALASGESQSSVVWRMQQEGGITDGTVRCLSSGGAPALVLNAARLLASTSASPAAEAPPIAAPATAAEPAPMPSPAPMPARPSPPRTASPKPARALPRSEPPVATSPPARRLVVTPSYEAPAWDPARPDPSAGEGYVDYGVNPFVSTAIDRMSTFAIDVDTGSYTMTRRKLTEGYLPPVASVRVEEFVNYLPYEYARPPEGSPFGVDIEMARSPWRDTEILRIGVQGKRTLEDRRKPVHLTFLVDTSGSMSSPDKLDLVKRSLTMLTEELSDGDTVAIAVYAGSAGLVLPPTPMSRKAEITSSLARLSSGGSTAMGAGISLAYEAALQSYEDGGVNRVIIASDGDANVGATSHEALSQLIRGYAKRGITLTTLGFGEGNYKDTTMEQLANDGDGNYFYIDSEREARRVLVDKMTSTLEVIAKDVKIQVQFDPKTVSSYRLLGYENRDVADKDFRDDAVDGGEIGSGHQVTAIYEIVRTGERGSLGAVLIRNKAPGPDAPAVERQYALAPESIFDVDTASRQFRMALASATFAEILRNSPHVAWISLSEVQRLAKSAARAEYPEDSELVQLIDRAMALEGSGNLSGM